jgi:hypothetical protein
MAIKPSLIQRCGVIGPSFDVNTGPHRRFEGVVIQVGQRAVGDEKRKRRSTHQQQPA